MFITSFRLIKVIWFQRLGKTFLTIENILKNEFYRFYEVGVEQIFGKITDQMNPLLIDINMERFIDKQEKLSDSLLPLKNGTYQILLMTTNLYY